jgi:hypothetical protein
MWLVHYMGLDPGFGFGPVWHGVDWPPKHLGCRYGVVVDSTARAHPSSLRPADSRGVVQGVVRPSCLVSSRGESGLGSSR